MKNLIEFLRRYAAVFLFVALEVVSIVLISSSSAYKQWNGSRVTREIFGPLLRQRANVASYLHLRKDNETMQEFQRELFRKAYNVDMDGQDVVDVYLDSMNAPLFEYSVANVLENTTSLPDNYLILDKGSSDGIQPGLGVVSDQGVVGVVKDVSPNFCTVMSVLHSKFNLSVILKDGVVTGVLYWDGRSHRKAIVRNVSSLDQIKPGDTLLTHHSLIFPSSYPVGTVYKVRKEVEDGFYTLEVRLGNRFDRMRKVWIVRNNYYEELKTLRDSLEVNE